MDLKTEVLAADNEKKFAEDYAANIRVITRYIRGDYKEEFVLYNGRDTARMIEALKARGLNAYGDNRGLGSVWVKL
jgi:hypothetical protein